jgi:hypothetical protein
MAYPILISARKIFRIRISRRGHHRMRQTPKIRIKSCIYTKTNQRHPTIPGAFCDYRRTLRREDAVEMIVAYCHFDRSGEIWTRIG